MSALQLNTDGGRKTCSRSSSPHHQLRASPSLRPFKPRSTLVMPQPSLGPELEPLLAELMILDLLLVAYLAGSPWRVNQLPELDLSSVIQLLLAE